MNHVGAVFREALLEVMAELKKTEEIIRIPNGIDDLEFAIGCKVMLRRNLNIPAGILNGSPGIVVDYYKPWTYKAGPEFILVKFKDYKGQVLVKTDRGVGLPIFREHCVEEDEETKIDVHSNRFQLDLDYSTTIHRSQGQTYEKLCVFLGDEELANGLTYTAFSRVSKWEDILILDDKIGMKRLVSDEVKAKNWRM